MQILSDFDIFSIVGFNKPLQVVGVRAVVKDDGALLLRFEGVFGSPMVSGICIRRAPKSSGIMFSPLSEFYLLGIFRNLSKTFELLLMVAVSQPTREYFMCTNCSTQIEYPSAQVCCE